MDNKQTIFFRADGDSKIGLGHIVRTSALASVLREHYHCVLATKCKILGVLTEAEALFSEVIQLQDTDFQTEVQHFSEKISTEALLVLDGYYFDDAYQKILFDKGITFFCIDDIHAYRFYADTIINTSGGITPMDYEAFPSTQFYLGPRYALLRQPFLEAAKKRRSEIDNKTCFICFGGADPDSQTIKLLQQQHIRDSFETFHVVVGSAFTYLGELRELVNTVDNITIHQSLSAQGMVELMKRCAYAICSPSTIVYEYMCCGGIVYLKQTANNQKDLMNFVTAEGLAFGLDEMAHITVLQKQEALSKQAFYFDGRSGERLLKMFQKAFEGNELRIRKANQRDLETTFFWANDPDVRLQSYNNQEISLQNHHFWFHQRLKDSNSFYYLLELEQQPVAQIRFLVKDGEAVLGYLADKTIRSKGLGTAILKKGIKTFLDETKKPIVITGYVKMTNIASQRSFEKLAFKKEKSTEYPDSYKYTMYYEN